MRQVDKILKKSLKKNVDDPKKYENVRERVTAVAWDIDLDGNNNNTRTKYSVQNMTNLQQTYKSALVSETNDDEDLILSYTYLPLRDLPMNNVVNKLQHELELEGEENSRSQN